MPQFDYATFSSQIFWLITVFCILYFFVSKKFIPSIGSVFEDRNTKINRSLDYASEIAEQAKAKEEMFTSLLTDARSGATDIVEKAKNKVKKLEEKSNNDLDIKIKVWEKEFENEIDQLLKESKEHMIKMSSELTVDIIKKVANINLKYKDAEKQSLLNYNKFLKN